MEKFVFNSLTEEDIMFLERTAKVFNMSKSSIESEKIVLASVDDPTYGSSVERLDVAVMGKIGEWTTLDTESKIEGYNEIPLGYAIGDAEYTRVMVIIRRMSNFLLDKSKYGETAYIYSIVSPDFEDAVKNPAFLGKMAQEQIYLDGTIDEVLAGIHSGFKGNERKEKELVDYIRRFLKG